MKEPVGKKLPNYCFVPVGVPPEEIAKTTCFVFPKLGRRDAGGAGKSP
jgi:hypothetical protein